MTASRKLHHFMKIVPSSLKHAQGHSTLHLPLDKTAHQLFNEQAQKSINGFAHPLFNEEVHESFNEVAHAFINELAHVSATDPLHFATSASGSPSGRGGAAKGLKFNETPEIMEC